MTTETENAERPNMGNREWVIINIVITIVLLALTRLAIAAAQDLNILTSDQSVMLWAAATKCIAGIALLSGTVSLIDALPHLLGTAAKVKNDAKESEAQ